jgi:DNA-binding transcriptional MerR regulator
MLTTQYVRSSEYPLRVHHVVRLFGGRVSGRTIRHWANRGLLPAFRNGPRIWCFRIADVQQFAARVGLPMQGLNLCMDNPPTLTSAWTHRVAF